MLKCPFFFCISLALLSCTGLLIKFSLLNKDKPKLGYYLGNFCLAFAIAYISPILGLHDILSTIHGNLLGLLGLSGICVGSWSLHVIGGPNTLFADNSGSTGQSSGTPEASGSQPSNSGESTSSKYLNATDGVKLSSDMHATLKQLGKVVYTLSEIKRSSKVTIIIDTLGHLDIDGTNSSLSDNDLKNVGKRVAIADRVYNTQLDAYKELLSKDKKFNSGTFGSGLSGSYSTIVNKHKNIFEYEK